MLKNRFFLILLAVILSLAACTGKPAAVPDPLPSPGAVTSAAAEPELPETLALTILHTNDLHGVLGNVPKYAAIISQVRLEEENVLLLDGGDLYRRGKYQRFAGAAETEIFNAMKYDAVAFGNNDFPLNNRELSDVSEHTIVKMAEFPILCANVTDNGEYVQGFDPFMVREFNGVRVAVIGLTSMKPAERGFDIARSLTFTDPVRSLREILPSVQNVSDVQIVLSHAGYDTDMRMRGVSAVIGADSHTKLSSPAAVNDNGRLIPVVQAGGEDDHYLGRLDLHFIKTDGVWVLDWYEGYLFTLDDVSPDPGIQAIIDKYDEMLAAGVTQIAA